MTQFIAPPSNFEEKKTDQKCRHGLFSKSSAKPTPSPLQPTRFDLQTPKMLIKQFQMSNLWKNACHLIFVQFRKIVEKNYKLVSAAV